MEDLVVTCTIVILFFRVKAILLACFVFETFGARRPVVGQQSRNKREYLQRTFNTTEAPINHLGLNYPSSEALVVCSSPVRIPYLNIQLCFGKTYLANNP
ncbi:uncharacterized protein F4822DRAFT_396933 [Hypoxylon trugodes]|uniref:uncharacterized protein n=1 Tax=Hypoxylon trugodes TaxID=326681 RepID=UPI00219AAF5C|nr:uncharacterized protein F4822DRAFT_396933 [Hypoxylon trugodes]KAI1391499.1 hypothetical protein F4822DRAFT_396933 [Hypoxylon trugodes]